MIIRPLRKNEAHKAKALLGQAFNYSVDVLAEVESLLQEEFIGAFCDDGETLMAQTAVKPYQSYFCGRVVDCVGVAGVSTYPEYRRNGCVKALFDEIFRLAPERGWALSLLYPFSYRYYRKFGYEALMRRKTLAFPFHILSHIHANVPGCRGVLFRGEPEILQGLLTVYDAYARRRNICFFRKDGAAYSADPAKSQKYTYLWYEGQIPRAYVTVKPAPDRVLEVTEIVYTDEGALRGVLGFLRLFDGQFKKLFISALEYDSPLDYLLDADRDIAYGCYEGVQGRMIDIKRFLEQNEYPEGEGHIKIKLYDDFYANNNGVYTLSYKNKAGKASFLADSGSDAARPADVLSGACPADAGYDAAFTIQSLSRLVLGDVPAYALPFLPGVSVKSEDTFHLLARLFPRRPVNLFEDF